MSNTCVLVIRTQVRNSPLALTPEDFSQESPPSQTIQTEHQQEPIPMVPKVVSPFILTKPFDCALTSGLRSMELLDSRQE
ncbi:hypothetical protein BPOR_0063g00170 [Botrytis porri]|uniref:Uncharacterized protein n=1 Tax=Botrytis porri TaxID=87229 RepID=A0A4Z1L0Y1_9HELO|nr:hypothetical protein BPOR_0063g00170 [Botrytis porri]